MAGININSDPIGFVLEAAWAELTDRGVDDAIYRLRDYCSSGDWGSAIVLAAVLELDRAKRAAAEAGLWDKDATNPTMHVLAKALWLLDFKALRDAAAPPPEPPPRVLTPPLTPEAIDQSWKGPKPKPGPRRIR